MEKTHKSLRFDKIANIEDKDFYLDLAFSRAKKSAQKLIEKEKRLYAYKKGKRRKDDIKDMKLKPSIEYKKDQAIARLNAIHDTLTSRFNMIIKTFPSIDNLPPYYKEVLQLKGFSLTDIKKALASLDWFNHVLNNLYINTVKSIRKAIFKQDIIKKVKEFYGRTSSLLDRISKYLKLLKQVKMFLLTLPIIKDMPTIVIVGFPNVGKTTLLRKLTGSKAKIANYAFTTLDINIGKLKIKDAEIQILDTPGTLNRPRKMNLAEKIAHLAMRYYGDMFIYVLDPTEDCALDEQLKLLKKVKEFKRPVMIYISKVDIVGKDKVKEIINNYLKEEHQICYDIKEIISTAKNIL